MLKMLLTGTISFVIAWAAHADDLFTVERTLPSTARAVLEWRVQIHVAKLRAGHRVTLPIPGAYLDVTPVRIERRAPDDLTWRGRTDDGRQIVLTVKGDAVYGIAYDGKEVYEFVPTAGGQVLRQVFDDATCGTEEPPLPRTRADDTSLGDGSVTKAAATSTTELRALYLYTQEVEAKAGSPEAVAAMAQGTVDQLNAIFANSLMDVHSTLVGVHKVDFTETGDLVTDLATIRNDPTAIDLRTELQANYVGLFVSQSTYWCGYSYIMRDPGPDFAPYAFHVTWSQCVGLDSHEVGHTLGFEHEPEDASVPPASASFPYSFGHRQEGEYRTVMSYACDVETCISTPFFSNPDVAYQGWPTGLADERDNARAGSQTAPIVAQFYVDPDAGVIFSSGFESGSAGGWSSITP